MPMREFQVGEFLEALGSKAPTPGGGAVAGLTGAIAASTARMVVSYSLGKKSLAEHQSALDHHADALDRTRDVFLGLADEDADAYAALNELWRLPASHPSRDALMPKAAERAASVPLAVAAAAVDLLRRLEQLAPITNAQLASDLAVAAIQALAAARSASWNVRANLPLLDGSHRPTFDSDARKLVDDATALAARVENACLGG